MTLEELGYSEALDQYRKDNNLTDFVAGRVIIENRERYMVRTDKDIFECELLGNLRYTAENRHDLPAVGDWVAITPFDVEHGIIHAIFPRKSIIERQAVGKFGDVQIIATNIDVALIIQAVDTDFNLNRLERYLTVSFSSRIEPVIILTKIDLLSKQEISELLDRVKTRIDDITVIALSNHSRKGYEHLEPVLVKGKTYCLLGSSGAGKSTLLNNLAGEQIMETRSISSSTGKGKHSTSHRELIVLPGGGIVIDNPGMREVGIADSGNGLESTFDEIINYSDQCRFADCTHTGEAGCAVIAAVEKGEIEKSEYENFLKLSRERARFQSTLAERRKKDKEFGKMVKEVKRIKKKGEDLGL